MIKLYILVFILCTLISVIAVPVGSRSSWGIIVIPCRYCQATNNLEVHHIIPQHIAPELARDTNNMVVLCRSCHFTVGHKNNWTNYFTNLMAVIREANK